MENTNSVVYFIQTTQLAGVATHLVNNLSIEANQQKSVPS